MSETIGARIRAVRGQDSQEAFASVLGISKGSLGFYERGENLPNAEVISKICSIKGVSADWLVLGKGSAYDPARTTVEPARAGVLRAGEPINKIVSKQAALDADLLETVIEVIEEALDDADRELSPAKKAQLVVAIYDLYQDSEKDVDKASVLRLVKSVA